MKSTLKGSLISLGIGAAALVFSATQAFAMSTVMDTADVRVYNGSGLHDLDYELKFDFSSDWGSFTTALTTSGLTSALLHVDLTPLKGFNGDRFRVFETPGDVTGNGNDKLIPLAGEGTDPSETKKYGSLALKDLGIQLWSVNNNPTSTYFEDDPNIIDFDLLTWYDATELEDLLLYNGGILNIGYADDATVAGASLTLTSPYTAPVSGGQPPIANPEPATLILFGSGLVGLAVWRLKKDKGLA